MPSLTTVTLDKRYAFYYKITIHTKSSSSSSLSFLDITSALERVLNAPKTDTPPPFPFFPALPLPLPELPIPPPPYEY